MNKLVTARRTVDMPEFYGGGYDLITGRRNVQPQMGKSPTAFTCMNIRASELANIPWRITKNDKILDSHKLIDMLGDFGEESNFQQAISATELDRFQYGAGLWLRDSDRLVRLDPDTIEVKKTSAGIKHFVQTINNVQTVFKRKEVVYFREYHPEDQLGYGIPVLEVCKKNISAEIEALLMIEAFFKNDAVPGLFLSSDMDIPDHEAERVLAWWEKRFRGARKKGKVGIAGRGLKPVQVGSNMRESQLIEILETCRNDICVAFRVDRILVGGNASATYLNLNESRKFLIEDVIIPRATEYANVINQDLVPYVDSSVKFEFAFDDLQILQESENEKQIRLGAMYRDNVISGEYYRQEMGIEESAKPEDKGIKVEQQWQKKAMKAFARGESPDVPFETDLLTIDRKIAIRAKLKNADFHEDAIKAAFARD